MRELVIRFKYFAFVGFDDFDDSNLPKVSM